MSCRISVFALAGLWVVGCGVSAGAETLRCQSVNGNLNCAGSSGVSCQTVNGRKTCVSGHGDVLQSFGGGAPPGVSADDGEDADDLDAARAPEGRELPRPRNHSPGGPSLDRD
jgi:hypothetical protein